MTSHRGKHREILFATHMTSKLMPTNLVNKQLNMISSPLCFGEHRNRRSRDDKD